MYMDLKEFASSMADAVQGELSGEAKVRLKEVRKNNGIVLKGLLFGKEGSNSWPVIYLEPYYQAYQEGKDFAGLACEIAGNYQSYAWKEEFQTGFFLSFEKVRETVAYKLVNYRMNQELLAEAPHLPYLDLAMVFYSLVCKTEAGMLTTLIRNSHLAMWNVTCRMLYEAARENTPRLLKARLGAMGDFLREEEDAGFLKGPGLYVLTNREHQNGAASLLYEGMLKRCAKTCGGNFFVMPSSIHEVILMPYQSGVEVGQLKDIVREGNQTQVAPQEILSDSVYFYSQDRKKLLVL